MELKRGICFCCGMTKVISEPPRKNIEGILFSLFPDKIFNINALKNCACLLQLCPTCLHKLILLKEANEKIQPINESSDVGLNFCLMCGKECLNFKISYSWNHFKDISEDFPLLSNSREIVMCSGCIFYLDTRNTVKIKLCSQYPELKTVPKLKLNLKEVTIHSTPKDMKKKQINLRNTIPIDIASEELKLDWSPLKGFRALKCDKLLKKSRLISGDSKFMDQILYIKINENDSLSSMNSFQDKNEKVEQIKSVVPKSRTRRSRNDQSGTSSLDNSSSNMESISECSETQSEKHTNNAPINRSRIGSNLSRYETRRELSKEKNNKFFKIKLKKNKKPIKMNKKQREENLHPNENSLIKTLVVNIQRHINFDQQVLQSFDEDNVLRKDNNSTKKIDSVENINIETSMESLVLENESMEGPQEIINETSKNNEHTINGIGYEQIEETPRESISHNIDEPDDNIEKTIKASSNVNVEEESELKKDKVSKEAAPEETDGVEKECDDEKTDVEIDLTKNEYTKENLMKPENDSMKDEYNEENLSKPENVFKKDEYTEVNLNEAMKNSNSNENYSVDDHFNEKSEVAKKDDKFDDKTDSKEESQDVGRDDLDKIEGSGNKSGDNENLDFNYENKDVRKENERDSSFNNDNQRQDENDVGLNEDTDIAPKLDKNYSNEKSVESNNLQESPGDSDIGDDDASTQYNKRKRNDSLEDSSSPDKKKKKVTFSDEVLDSPR